MDNRPPQTQPRLGRPPPPPPSPTIIVGAPPSPLQLVPAQPNMGRWHYGEVDNGHIQVHGLGVLFALVIFSLLLFFALLFLYSRWACRYRHMVVTVTSPGGHGLQQSSSSSVPPPAGLSKDVIEAIPLTTLVRVPSSGGSGDPQDVMQCPICLSGVGVGEKVKVLPGCGHAFHPECVDEWLRAHSTCPLCRASMKSADSVADPMEVV